LFAGDAAFKFRHLLIRDTAYDSLPKADRAQLHARFADWLLLHASDLEVLDLMAGYHLEQALCYWSEIAAS
jgi:predicted ATPase